MAFKMGKDVFVLLLTLLLLIGGLCSVSASSSPGGIVSGFLSTAFSVLMKCVGLSLRAITRTAISRRPKMNFENGYVVKTVFDGSKLGIEPYAIEILPDRELLILDSANSNLYRISSSLSLYSKPKLVSGSAEGYSGFVDGRLRKARMNHPKGLTVDDRGNIYIADTDNMAIRKISDSGISTIAGGKYSFRGGHVDGPSEDAKFSNDFDVAYSGSSCSLLVIDRGNKAIREIQLHFDDCAYQYLSGFPFGIALVIAAGLLGYMLALLQRRVGSTLSPGIHKKSLKPQKQGQHQYQQQQKNSDTWHVQESFVIPDEDGPPAIETRDPTPQKTYAFMSTDSEKIQHLQQTYAFYNRLDGDLYHHQQRRRRKKRHCHQHHTSTAQAHSQQSSATAHEIVFGAAQEDDRQRDRLVIKPLDQGISGYNHHNIRS